MEIHVYFVVIPFLLLLAAIFAAAEASLFSLSRSNLESLRGTRPRLYRRIKNLIFEPDELLSTIIIGNESLNILIGTFVAALFQIYCAEAGEYVLIILSVGVTSLMLLTFSEILPKILAFRLSIRIASSLALPMSLAHTLLTPFRVIFLGISRNIISLFGIKATPPAVISEKDFLTLVEVGAESGSLDRDEKDMIFNVFTFSDLQVATIMIPWNDVFHVMDDHKLDEILEQLKGRHYSRIPVVSKSENRVVGILYARELIKLLLQPDEMKKIEALKNSIVPPYIVSTHQKVSNIFRDLKARKTHIALVVDEYGNHVGLVTLEDILNALFNTQPGGGTTTGETPQEDTFGGETP